jgi:hypothetical protein
MSILIIFVPNIFQVTKTPIRNVYVLVYVYIYIYICVCVCIDYFLQNGILLYVIVVNTIYLIILYKIKIDIKIKSKHLMSTG